MPVGWHLDAPRIATTTHASRPNRPVLEFSDGPTIRVVFESLSIEATYARR